MGSRIGRRRCPYCRRQKVGFPGLLDHMSTCPESPRAHKAREKTTREDRLRAAKENP